MACSNLVTFDGGGEYTIIGRKNVQISFGGKKFTLSKCVLCIGNGARFVLCELDYAP